MSNGKNYCNLCQQFVQDFSVILKRKYCNICLKKTMEEYKNKPAPTDLAVICSILKQFEIVQLSNEKPDFT